MTLASSALGSIREADVETLRRPLIFGGGRTVEPQLETLAVSGAAGVAIEDHYAD